MSSIGIGIGIPAIRTLGKGGNSHVYELRDEFVVDEITPITSPRTAEPGPGTLTIVDTENKLSISGGRLICAGGKATPQLGDPGVWSSVNARVAGLCVTTLISRDSTSTFTQVGWSTASTQIIDQGVYLVSAGRINVVVNTGLNFEVGNYVADQDYDFGVVARNTGFFLFVKGGAFSEWTLLWVDDVGGSANLFGAFAVFNGSGDFDKLRVLDLPANGYTIWSDDYGIADDRLAGARSALDTFTHSADCIIEFEATTLPSVGNIDVAFRQQDSTHEWIIRINSAGDLDLIEDDAGETQRATAVAALLGGERIVVIADDNVIRCYHDNTLAWTYSAAANFITETSGELTSLGTGGAVSDIVAWSRTFDSGDEALVSLEAASA